MTRHDTGGCRRGNVGIGVVRVRPCTAESRQERAQQLQVQRGVPVRGPAPDVPADQHGEPPRATLQHVRAGLRAAALVLPLPGPAERLSRRRRVLRDHRQLHRRLRAVFLRPHVRVSPLRQGDDGVCASCAARWGESV